MGGVCAFFNPEPVADFFDICFIGEADEMLPEFIDLYKSAANKPDVLKSHPESRVSMSPHFTEFFMMPKESFREGSRHRPHPKL